MYLNKYMENKIYINDSKILISTEDKEIIENIKSHFTYDDNSECFVNGAYYSDRIKKVCFVKKIKNYHWINRGLLFDLIKFIKQNNLNFTFVDERAKVKSKEFNEEIRTILPTITLHNYQMEAIEKCLKHRFGIVKAFTSFGKSITMAALLKYINVPFLILVNKKTLATQLWAELNKFGVECGVLHSQKKIIKQSMITTVQSVGKIGNLSDIKAICIDECHNSASDTYQGFLEKIKVPYLFGFSATPFKNEYHSALVKQFCGDIIYDISLKEGVENNIITKPYVYFINNTCPKAIDWPSSEQLGIINNNNRNEQIVDIVKNNETKHFLIIIDKIKHGMLLLDKLPDSIFVDGSTGEKDRHKAIEKIERGEVKVIIASRVFLEGISIKNVDCLINAAGMNLAALTIQKAGRALRKKEGKEKAIIIEFADVGNKILHKQALSRLRAYKQEGYTEIFKINDIEEINF